MVVPFTREEEAQVARVAGDSGTDAASFVRDAVLGVIREQEHLRAMIAEGIAQADRGEFIEEDEMDRRFAALMQS